MATTRGLNCGNNGQGMKWITHKRRLAIYLRDGLACAYCGATVEDGAQLTLDHGRPRDHGGSNKETNLVTACARCNSVRGTRPWKVFVVLICAAYDRPANDVIKFIETTRRRVLDVKAAQEMIDRRGGFSQALYGRSVA